MASVIDISRHLTRRRRLLVLPGMVFVLWLIVAFFAYIVTSGVVILGYFSYADSAFPPWYVTGGFVLLMAAASFAAAGASLLTGWAFFTGFSRYDERLILLSGAILVGVLAAIFWKDADLIPILLVASAIFGAMALLAWAAKAWLRRDPLQRHLVDAPRSGVFTTLLRYELARVSALGPAARLVLDIFLLSLAVLLVIAGWAAITMFGLGTIWGVAYFVSMWFVAKWLTRFAIGATRRFRSSNVRAARALFQIDERPGVLFLRSFTDDNAAVEHRRSIPERLMAVSGKLGRRLEEILADVAFRFGPVAALSDPNSTRPLLGAARDVSSNDHWQDYVLNKLGQCQDVVLVVGRTEGLKWELGVISDHALADKLIIVLPPGRNSTAAEIRSMLPKAFQVPAFKERKALLLFRLPTGGWWLAVAEKDDTAAYEEAMLLAFQMRRNGSASPP